MYENTDSKKGITNWKQKIDIQIEKKNMYNALNEHGLNCFVIL